MQEKFPQHIQRRGAHTVRCWIDWATEIVTFPLWGINGSLLGYQRYSWNQPKKRSNIGKYFTWITEEYKPLAFWGMEYVTSKVSPCGLHSEVSQPPLLVCEGIFDAIRCIQCGFRACAILTATPSKQFVQWFNYLTYHQMTIAIKDNDGAKSGLDKLGNSGIITCEWHKDMGDHTVNEADEWLNESLKHWI